VPLCRHNRTMHYSQKAVLVVHSVSQTSTQTSQRSSRPLDVMSACIQPSCFAPSFHSLKVPSFLPPLPLLPHHVMSANIPFFRRHLTPALITVTPPSVVLARLSNEPAAPHDIDRHSGTELCEIIVRGIEDAHRHQQTSLIRDAYRYLVALHHLPAGTTVDPWWDRLCAVHDSTELKKAVFVVAHLLHEGDTLLLQYIREPFFPVSYLRYCLTHFVESKDGSVLELFRQAKSHRETQGRPLTLDEFNALYDTIDRTPESRKRSSRKGKGSQQKQMKKEAVTIDPYELLHVPLYATKQDLDKARRRRIKQLECEYIIYAERHREAREELYRAVEAIQHERQSRVPLKAAQQDECLELAAHHDELAKQQEKKRKLCPRHVATVPCDVCKLDCVSDDNDTLLCNNKRCVNECHFSCLPADVRIPQWRCSRCAIKGAAPQPVCSTTSGRGETSNQAPPSTSDRPPSEMELQKEAEIDMIIRQDIESNITLRQLYFDSSLSEEGLPVVAPDTPTLAASAAAIADPTYIEL